MGNKRASRFLIDKIDERLGSVEKEIKFDIAVVIAGIALTVAGMTGFVIDNGKHPGFCTICLMLSITGVCFAYVMTKEYIADCKIENRKTKQNKRSNKV